MKNFKSLVLAAAALVAITTSAKAEWVNTGHTRFEPTVTQTCQDGQKVKLTIHIEVEQKEVNSKGHFIGQPRWVNKAGLPVQFLVHPSTGLESVPGNTYVKTDAAGKTGVYWVIPANNTWSHINYEIDCLGNGGDIRRSWCVREILVKK